MKLFETDRREFCPRCGWVGRRAFQLDRHDLCEGAAEETEAETVEAGITVLEDQHVDVENDHGGTDASDLSEDAQGTDDDNDDDEEEAPAPQWGRASSNRRGIPPKKTVAARRITKVELQKGLLELKILGADKPYDRPKTRGECQLCPVCQLVRDGKSDGLDRAAFRALGQDSVVAQPGHLACGHRAAEVLYHSRPCIFIACKHSLFLDVSESGSLILNFPHLTPSEMRPDQSCSLDLAERGGMTLEQIAVVTNLTRERIRQVETKTLFRRARPAALSLGLNPEDVAEVGMRRSIGPGADHAEIGVGGEVPSDVVSLLEGDGDGKTKRKKR